MNRILLRSSAYLVPDGSNQWSILTEGGETISSGAFAATLLPGDLEADSIRTIGESLGALEQGSGRWLEWGKETPLVPGMSEAIKIQPIERDIRKYLGYLVAVCNRPRARLEVEIERLSINRARRMPPAAANYLASHTEDWERPLLRGVLPKRVLAEVRDDELDIYENRVVARLIDRLAVHLAHRVFELRRLRSIIQEASNYYDAMSDNYSRNFRICTLWAETVLSNLNKNVVDKSLTELETLQHTILGLMDRPLYAAVPVRASVPLSLRGTNIFANDQDYRQVGLLWQSWTKNGITSIPTPQQSYDAYQKLCHGFERYCMLLVIRALKQLRLAPSIADEQTIIMRGGRLRIQYGCDIELRWCEDGTFTFETGNAPVVRLVPLACSLATAQDGGAATAVLTDLAADYERSRRGPVLALYVAPPSIGCKPLPDPIARRLHNAGNEPLDGHPKGLGLLPVSPWEIGSVETVARALRWYLSVALARRYPPVVAKPPADSLNVATGFEEWAKPSATGDWRIIRAPTEQQLERLGVKSALRKAFQHLQHAQQRQTVAARAQQEARQNSRATEPLKRRKREADAESVTASKRHEQLLVFNETLKIAVLELRCLQTCPICGNEISGARESVTASEGFLKCLCAGCKSVWGVRRCHSCQEQVPFLLSGSWTKPSETPPGWVDQVLGCDVLAIPVWEAGRSERFVCPGCGEMC